MLKLPECKTKFQPRIDELPGAAPHSSAPTGSTTSLVAKNVRQPVESIVIIRAESLGSRGLGVSRGASKLLIDLDKGREGSFLPATRTREKTPLYRIHVAALRQILLRLSRVIQVRDASGSDPNIFRA